MLNHKTIHIAEPLENILRNHSTKSQSIEKEFMKKFVWLALIFSLFQACEVDDTAETCSDNCTSVIGKIIRADNTGIPDVKVTFSFVQFAPYSYTRNIAETYTDENGNYEIIGFIKDRELGPTYSFRILAEIEQIENSINDNFVKPSEIIPQVAPRVNETIISGITDRSTIEIVDFIVPFKSDLTVRLNNFLPIEDIDKFHFESTVEYGFREQFFPINNDRAVTLNDEFSFNTGIGLNKVEIRKWKNGIFFTETQEVNITENPSNISIDFDY